MFKDLMNHNIKDHECISHILQDYFPEYETVFTSDSVKYGHKYEWLQYIVIKYFDQLYKIDYIYCSNGGYLTNRHSQQISNVNKTERKVKTIEVVYYD